MTVRVSKPEFNLREKISELDKPVGLKGNEILRSETSQEVRDLIGADRRNLFINGDMRIDQRSNGSATIPSGTSYTSVDRWKAVISPGSKFSMQKKSDSSLLYKTGFPNYMRLTVTSAVTLGSSQYQLFWHTIEAQNLFDRTGFGYLGAKDLTLSFWVRSSVAGPFSGSLENWNQNRAFVWEVNINNENTWEYKTVSIPRCTDGIWQTNTTNGGAYFMFSLGTTITGTANSGWVNGQKLGSATEVKRIGINGCTVDITGCQLEIGNVATEFEHRSYAEEFEVCQRYFQSNFPQGVNPQNGYYTTTSNLAAGFNGVVSFSGGQARAPWVMFHPKMRSTPTVTLYSASSSDTAGKWAAYKGSWNASSSNSIDYFGGNGFGVRYGSGGHAFVTGEAYLYRGMWKAEAEI